MKPLLSSLLLLALTIAAHAENVALGNRVILDATVRKLDAFTARVAHSEGSATVPAWELSEAVQRNAGFDPVATAAERERRKAAKLATEAQRKREAERIAMEAAQKERDEKERLERIEKETRARIAEENTRKEDDHAAGVMLNEALKNPVVWMKSPSLKRLHELVSVVVPAYERRSRDMMMAAPGDALAAAGLQQTYEHRGQKPLTASEFSALSQESKRQIAIFVPGLMPGSTLGDSEKEMNELWAKMVGQFSSEMRARRVPATPSK